MKLVARFGGQATNSSACLFIELECGSDCAPASGMVVSPDVNRSVCAAALDL
jgi:hypothetical protein